MVKKFTAKCDFNGEKHPVTLYVGQPSNGSHPLAFQSKWLANSRNGKIPADIMDAFDKISEIAEKHRIAFDELCAYVIEEIKSSDSIVEDFNQASEFSSSIENDEDAKEDEGDDRFTKPAEQEVEINNIQENLDQIINDDSLDQEEEEEAVIADEVTPVIIKKDDANKKPKKHKEAPIADEGMQSPLKHKRNDPRFNPHASSLKKKGAEQKKKSPTINRQSNIIINTNTTESNFSFYNKNNASPSVQQIKVEPAAAQNNDNLQNK